MKQIIFSLLAFTVCLLPLQAQTASKLIEKYRKLPNATYMDTSKETLKSYDENPDPALTEEERAQLRKNFKMSEVVQIEKCDEKQLAKIEKDIKALKGYELLFVTNKNGGSDEDANVVRKMMSDMMNPTIKVQTYGKAKGNTVSDILIRVDLWETVALIHLDTKLDKELMVKSLMEQENFGFEIESDSEDVDMKDALEDVKNGNVLFVIEGKEYPDLHSTKEASEYMMLHNIRHNTESWIIGSYVKEKYPNTDKKVVIEFSDYTKELQKYVDAGDVLFVIKDKEYPELRSIEAAKEFMKANNIKCYNQHWVSESEAKTKYPTVKRKAIIEYY